MKIAYQAKKFHPGSLNIIEKANEIIAEYESAGYSLTLRQLYYQFVSRDLISNKLTEYKRIGQIINDARIGGLISWSAIEDRTRNLKGVSSWDSPKDILYSAASSFRLDPWLDQDDHVEVWIEKDALTGIVEPVCNRLRVDYFACRGYSSQSEQWRAGRRLAGKIDEGKRVTVIHLGDHDPSGIDMTRDNDDRLAMFIGYQSDSSQFSINRIALNMDQIKKHKPPPNPAKLTDSRCRGYIKKFGKSSWELDALDPKIIGSLIEKTVNKFIDRDAWDKSMRREEKIRAKLNKNARNFKA